MVLWGFGIDFKVDLRRGVIYGNFELVHIGIATLYKVCLKHNWCITEIFRLVRIRFRIVYFEPDMGLGAVQLYILCRPSSNICTFICMYLILIVWRCITCGCGKSIRASSIQNLFRPFFSDSIPVSTILNVSHLFCLFCASLPYIFLFTSDDIDFQWF